MNKPSKKTRNIILGVMISLIVGAVVVNFGARRLQVQAWIAQPVETQLMSMLRPSTTYGTFEAKNLLQRKVRIEKNTLYNALFYAEVRTAICTMTQPEEFTAVAAYLVDTAGVAHGGWYEPALVRYGIMKVAFEELNAEAFVSLDLVDQAQVGPDGYDPKEENITRIRFPLNG